MPMYRPDSERCRRCLIINHPAPCWAIPSQNEPTDCPYSTERERITLPPVPSSVDRCTELYPLLDDVPSELCVRCGLNRGVNATCCHNQQGTTVQEETIDKSCSKCRHNYGPDGKIKYCGQVCTWLGREDWMPRIIDEPTPVVVTASRFYTPTVEDGMKEIKPTIGWEE